MNAFQSLRERDNIKKAVIFFPLTALLATVAGLITHFDAPGHATGLPVTDMRIAGIIPVWVMTALRAVAVIGFLLTSRFKEVSFHNCARSGARKRCRARNNARSRPSRRSTIRLSPQLWWVRCNRQASGGR